MKENKKKIFIISAFITTIATIAYLTNPLQDQNPEKNYTIYYGKTYKKAQDINFADDSTKDPDSGVRKDWVVEPNSSYESVLQIWLAENKSPWKLNWQIGNLYVTPKGIIIKNATLTEAFSAIADNLSTTRVNFDLYNQSKDIVVRAGYKKPEIQSVMQTDTNQDPLQTTNIINPK